MRAPSLQHAHAPSPWPSSQPCCCRRPTPRRAAPACRAMSEELRRLLGDSYLRPDFDQQYSDEHVDELVDAAAGLISVIDELRPLDPDSFNAFYEIYKAIAAVPPRDRVRVLQELEPGAIFSLWRASIGQYTLDDARKGELFENHVIWDDFPREPGEVFTYEGVCEQFRYEQLEDPLARPGAAPTARSPSPRARPRTRDAPWLKPSPGTMAAPQERFRQQFFVASRTGLLHSRLLLDLGPLAAWLAPPMYSRLEVGLTLLPHSPDAGADAALVYPADAQLLAQRRAAGVALEAADLPGRGWPAPAPGPAWSPLSFGDRDYLRLAGPGFYVGCAYRRDERGTLLDGEHVYFALARSE